jgi:importin subunit alpha-1
MHSKDHSLFVPSLRSMGNILTSSDSLIIERCLFHNVLTPLTEIMFSNSSHMIKECCWALSNITAGPSAHIEALVESEAFNRIIQLTKSYSIDNRKEAVWVLVNAITGADAILKKKIFEHNGGIIVKILAQGLIFTDNRLLNNVLEALDELLNLDKVFGW